MRLTGQSGTGWGSVSLLKKLDTSYYNVVVVSPRNYFLFTPLLPSCTTGLIEHRSIMEPIRNILRHKRTTAQFYEAETTKIDYEKRVVHISDLSEIRGDVTTTEVPFDLLVIGVGAENATFGESQIALRILERRAQRADKKPRRQAFLACENTRASSRKSVTRRPSARRSWTASRRPRSRANQPRKSSDCCTWSSSVEGPPESSLPGNCETFSCRI